MKKQKKTSWVFLYIKYSKFWSVLLEHCIERKPLIYEEWVFRQNPWVRQIELGQKHQNKMNGNTRTNVLLGQTSKNCCCHTFFFALTQSGASHKIPKVSTMPTRKGHISMNLNTLTWHFYFIGKCIIRVLIQWLLLCDKLLKVMFMNLLLEKNIYFVSFPSHSNKYKRVLKTKIKIFIKEIYYEPICK